jgi:hypothetical protein
MLAVLGITTSIRLLILGGTAAALILTSAASHAATLRFSGCTWVIRAFEFTPL